MNVPNKQKQEGAYFCTVVFNLEVLTTLQWESQMKLFHD